MSIPWRSRQLSHCFFCKLKILSKSHFATLLQNIIPYRKCGRIKLQQKVFSAAKMKQSDTLCKRPIFYNFCKEHVGCEISQSSISIIKLRNLVSFFLHIALLNIHIRFVYIIRRLILRVLYVTCAIVVGAGTPSVQTLGQKQKYWRRHKKIKIYIVGY